MSLISDAQIALRSMRDEHLSVDIIYRRGGAADRAIRGCKAATSVTVDDGQAIVKTQVADWLIDVAVLVTVPMRGDQINHDSVRYEVADVGSEHCWRYHGSDRKTFRIHCKIVPSGETP